MALVSLANDMMDYERNYVHSLNANSFELMLAVISRPYFQTPAVVLLELGARCIWFRSWVIWLSEEFNDLERSSCSSEASLPFSSAIMDCIEMYCMLSCPNVAAALHRLMRSWLILTCIQAHDDGGSTHRPEKFV